MEDTILGAVFDELQMLEALCELVEEETEARVRTFDNAGIMIYNKGFIVYLGNGAEFQITVVKSKNADLEPCEKCGKLTDDMWCEKCAEEVA